MLAESSRALTRFAFALVLLFTVTGHSLAAGDQGIVQLTAFAELEEVQVDADGARRVEFLPAEKVVPGDVVLYRTRYLNRGGDAAEQVVIRNPIPEHMVYVMGSAFGELAQVDFSVDGGESFAAPELLRVPDGEGGQRAAAAADFTDIRWILERGLAPGEDGQVGFRAQLQ